LIDDGYAAPYYYFKQLKFLQEKLKSNKIAHCDVKPANMVWSDKNGLCLIDSDDIVEFGSIRQVGTPGINCSLNKLTQNETVDA
jgi:serine/threonine protein kinase